MSPLSPDFYTHGAEALQRRDDEQEADGWSTLFAIGFALLGTGIIIGAVAELILSHLF